MYNYNTTTRGRIEWIMYE